MQKHVVDIGLKVILATLFLLAVPVGPLSAGSFTADVVETQRGKTRAYKIFVLDHQYRLDGEDDGRPLHIMVNRKSGKTHLIVPSEKVYLQIDNDSMQSLSNNPFEARYFMAGKYETRSGGRETVNGLACDKQIISAQGRDVMTAWIASRYNFAVKLENNLNGLALKLENLRDGGVKAAMFQVPEGFKQVASMPVPPPDWAGDIAAAPVMTPPFEKSLQQGQIIRIKPVRDHHVDLKAQSLSGVEGSFSSNAFKDGRPLKIVAAYAGGGRKIHKETPHQADEIVVRAASGNVKISAELIEAPEGIVLTQYFFKSMSGRELHPDQDKPFLLQLTDRAGDNRDSRGTLTFFTGRAQHKQLLKKEEFNLSEGRSRVWRYDPDQQIGTVDVMALAGGVDVRLEQPEKAGMIPPSWARAAANPPAATVPETTVAQPEPPPAASTAAEPGAQKSNAPSRMFLVLDASGSMWGQIDGKAKIAIAKQALVELIQGLPDHSHAGLVAYGHRREGDCQDVEELEPLQPIDKSALIDKIKAISPKGKTPITLSIKTTAEKLKAVEEETIIILVSDGKETCEGDPCALVEKLKAAGIKFTMYVIGFDVTEEEKAQLECMAKAGDGRYFTAKTAREFTAATQQAVRESRSFGYLKITALRNGEPLSARIDAFPQGKKHTIKSSRAVTDPNWPGTELKPGIYDLVVTDDKIRPPQSVKISSVTVTAGGTTEKTADFSGGRLSVAVAANNQKETASLYVYSAGTDNQVATGDTSRDNPKALFLAPGVYDLQVVYRKSKPESERFFKGIEINPGQTVEKQVEFGQGRLSIEALINGGKGSVGLYVFLAGTNQRVTTGDTSRDNPKVFTLNAGSYDLKVAYRKAIPEMETVIRDIHIVPGQTVDKRAEYQEGILEVKTTSQGKAVRGDLKFFRPGENKRIASGTAGKQIKMQPGRYDVVVRAYKLQGKPEKRIAFTIQAGQTTTLEVDF